MDALIPQDWFRASPQIANQTVADHILKSILQEIGNPSAIGNAKNSRWVNILAHLLKKSVCIPEVVCNTTNFIVIEADDFKKICEHPSSHDLFDPIIYQIRGNSSYIESKFYLRVLGKNYRLTPAKWANNRINKKIYANHPMGGIIAVFRQNYVADLEYGIIRFQIGNRLDELIEIIEHNKMQGELPIRRNNTSTTIYFTSSKLSSGRTRKSISNFIDDIRDTTKIITEKFDQVISMEPDADKQQKLKGIQNKILDKLNELTQSGELLATYVATVYSLTATTEDIGNKTVFECLPEHIQKILSEESLNQYSLKLKDCITSEEYEFMQVYIQETTTGLMTKFDFKAYVTSLHEELHTNFIDQFIDQDGYEFAATRNDKRAIFVAHIINKLYANYKKTGEGTILSYISSIIKVVEEIVEDAEMDGIKLLIGNELCYMVGCESSKFSETVIEEISAESAIIAP
ncbi:MAG: hypothetical protein KBD37_02365 [Burkholderiales bacterium]|nr:hypothetical protein [Burkholderiales bacterium]